MATDDVPREVRKRVTVVFCDLTGSTALGEQLDPEVLRGTMRRYYDECRAILERHGGTVEKFIGDAVMAVFGVPQAHEDDALRAVRAASELRAAVHALGLVARIGINSGEVVAGDGDSLVTGDAVNIAARLEQAAEAGEILIGAETRDLVRDAVRVDRIELELKGKSAPVAAYRLEVVDPDAPGVLRRFDSPLVGRTRELQRLRDDFDHVVRQGSSQLFTLIGQPGVGKSRLVGEFTRDLDGRARVVRGRCLHYGEGITYWPLVEVLLQIGADAEAVLGLPSPREAAVATRKLFEVEATREPLVVVWDDIQWAEPTFLDLVEHVVDWSRGAPILVLCIARPELLDVRPGWGGGKSNATSLLLEPLAEREASALIDNLLGTTALAEPLRARILRSSGGNPLFVEEMLLMLREDEGDGEIEVPPTIHALLQARLDRLDLEQRTVIERGSVEGEVFHRAPVEELAPPPVRTGLDGHLQRLIRNELIHPEPATMPGDDAFRFRHLLIRDAAYESLPKEVRADLHERFALWLDEHVRLVEQDEIVGYHLEQAVIYRRELGRDDPDLAKRAAERLAAAGRAAGNRGDALASAGLLERAATLLPIGGEQRLALLPHLVRSLIEGGGYQRVAPRLEELDRTGDERWQAYATVLRPHYETMIGRGSLEGSLPQVDEARTVFERLGDDLGIALSFTISAYAAWTACRAADATIFYDAAIDHAERAGVAPLADDLRGYLIGTYTHGPMPVDHAEAELRELLESARGPMETAAAKRALGRLAAMRGDFDTGRRLMREGREPLTEIGARILYAATSQGAANVEELAGRLEAAVEVSRKGCEELTALDEHSFASTAASNTAHLLARLGHDEEAQRWVTTARELSPEFDVSTLSASDVTEGLLHSRRGEHERALELVRRGLAQAETTDFWAIRGPAYEVYAEVLSRAGDREGARDAAQKAIRVYEEKGVRPAIESARALLAQL